MMKRACVIGWPIKHSRSPLIHGHWLKTYGIEGAYIREAVAPEGLGDFLDTLADRGFAGCNVTVPHKEAVFARVEVADSLTSHLQAVNTVYLEDGRLMGTNTDGIGFLNNLKAGSPAWTAGSGPAMVLGAGGAARAVIAALLADGVPEVRLANRTRERADALASHFGERIKVTAWEAREDRLAECALLVNTTSLGMSGMPALEISLDRLPVTASVNDIVYAPLMTDLLDRAAERGNPVVDGLGMLLHQAVPGFRLWFGVQPEVTNELRQLIVSDLDAG